VFGPSPLQLHNATTEAAADADLTADLTAAAAAGLPSAAAAAQSAAAAAAAEGMREGQSLGGCVLTRVVGRRFHRGIANALPRGARCALRRDAANAADAHALLVVPMAGDADDLGVPREGPTAVPLQSLGHVPRGVAGVLSPLLDRGWLRLMGTLTHGAAASRAAPAGDAPRLALAATAARALAPAAAAAARAGWAAAAAAAAAADAAGGAPGAAGRNLRLVIQAALSSGTANSPADSGADSGAAAADSGCDALFSPAHAAALRALTALPPPAAALLVRLYGRKGPWFRVPLLRYADVADAADNGDDDDGGDAGAGAAVDALCAAGAARALPRRADDGDGDGGGSEEEEDDVAARYGVLNAVELRAAAAAATAAAAGAAAGGGITAVTAPAADASRAGSLRALLAARRAGGRRGAAGAAAAEAAWAAAAVRACRLTSSTRAALRRAFLLFFLSPAADLSTFTRADLGAARYPAVTLGVASPPPAVTVRVFASAAALDAYEQALACAASADEALEARDDATLARHAARAVAALGWDAAPLRRLSGDGAAADDAHADADADTRAAAGAGADVMDVDAHADAVAAAAVVGVDTPVAGVAASTVAPAAAPAAAPVAWHLARFTAAHVHAGVASRGVAALERARRYGDAAALLTRLLNCSPESAHDSAPLRPASRGGWWVRLSTDLEHAGRIEDALAAAEAGLTDGWTAPAEVDALRCKILRLAVPPRRWKPPPWAAAAAAAPAPRVVRLRAPAALRAERGRKNLFAAPTDAAAAAASASASEPAAAPRLDDGDDDDAAPAAAAAAAAAAALALADADGAGGAASASAPPPVTIEALALAHYAASGWRGAHAESGVWRTLFGLLFWDVLFCGTTAPPGAFQHPFQTAPLDLGAPGFASGARAPRLAARLAAIAAGRAPRLLAAAWALRRGTLAAGVSWRRHSLAQLQDICAAFGGAAVAAIMRLLASDYTAWRAGMPDLVLWRFSPPSSSPNEEGTAARNVLDDDCRGEGMLVEVKGPRDALRPGQRAWAAALLQAGVAVEVLQFE
jgi:Fanconi-associated nuclease 1